MDETPFKTSNSQEISHESLQQQKEDEDLRFPPEEEAVSFSPLSSLHS